MSYILSIVIYLGMILLDSLLQSLTLFHMIHLSRSWIDMFDLICNLVVVFMIYFCIKLKLKVLIYQHQLPIASHLLRQMYKHSGNLQIKSDPNV